MKKVVGFIGLCKNVGKTTFLNKYIKEKEKYLITSIGWDGEAIDHIFGIKKPSIFVKKGSSVCTYSNLKPTKSEKISELPIENQFLGKLEIYRMKENDIVQVAGPSSITQLKTFLKFAENLEISEIIIDGAADRRITLSVSNEIFYICGPTYSQNEQKLIRTIIGIIEMFNIPIIEPNQQFIEIKSINKTNINTLDENQKYVIEDFSKIVIDYELIPKVLKKYKIFVKKKPEKLNIVINSFNADLMKHTLNTSKIKEEVGRLISNTHALEIIDLTASNSLP